jgi:hypothetical protein
MSDIALGGQTDGIFIEIFTNFSDIKTVVGFLADGNNSCLNFEIAGKFPTNQPCHLLGEWELESNLGIGTHQDIRF